MVIVNTNKADYHKPKKQKAGSPLSMFNLNAPKNTDTTSETESEASDNDFLLGPSVNQKMEASTRSRHQHIVETLTNAFTTQSGNFKLEIKDMITKAQQEDKELMNTSVVKENSMSNHLQKKDEEIKHLQIGLDNSQLKVQFLEGRLSRMEKKIDDLQEDLLQEKARSMRSNLAKNLYPLKEPTGWARRVSLLNDPLLLVSHHKRTKSKF